MGAVENVASTHTATPQDSPAGSRREAGDIMALVTYSNSGGTETEPGQIMTLAQEADGFGKLNPTALGLLAEIEPKKAEEMLGHDLGYRIEGLTLLEYLRDPPGNMTQAEATHHVLQTLADSFDNCLEVMTYVVTFARANKVWLSHPDPDLRDPQAYAHYINHNFSTIIEIASYSNAAKSACLKTIRRYWGPDWLAQIPASVRPECKVEGNELSLPKGMLEHFANIAKGSLGLSEACEKLSKQVEDRRASAMQPGVSAHNRRIPLSARIVTRDVKWLDERLSPVPPKTGRLGFSITFEGTDVTGVAERPAETESTDRGVRPAAGSKRWRNGNSPSPGIRKRVRSAADETQHTGGSEGVGRRSRGEVERRHHQEEEDELEEEVEGEGEGGEWEGDGGRDTQREAGMGEGGDTDVAGAVLVAMDRPSTPTSSTDGAVAPGPDERCIGTRIAYVAEEFDKLFALFQQEASCCAGCEAKLTNMSFGTRRLVSIDRAELVKVCEKYVDVGQPSGLLIAS